MSTHSSTLHTSVLHEGEWSTSRSSRFSPKQKATGSSRIGGWVDSKATGRFWEEKNFLPLSGNELRFNGCPTCSLRTILTEQSWFTNRCVLYIPTLCTVIIFAIKAFICYKWTSRSMGYGKSQRTRPENMGCIWVRLSTAVYSEHARARGGLDHQLSCP